MSEQFNKNDYASCGRTARRQEQIAGILALPPWLARCSIAGFFLLSLVFLLVLTGTSSFAQTSDDLSTLVEAAKESGSRVIIVDPSGTMDKPPAAKVPTGTAALLAARDELVRIIEAMRLAPGQMTATLDRHGGGQGAGWVLPAVLLGIVYLLIGYGGERLFANWGRRRFMYLFNAEPKDRAERIGYLIVRAIMMFIGVAVMAGVALVLAALFAGGDKAVWTTQRVLITYVFLVRAILVLIFNLVAPDAASHRSIALSDTDSHRIYRGSIVVFVTIGTALGLCKWMDGLGLNPDAHKLALVFGLGIAALSLIVLAISNRKAIANALVSGAAPADLSVTARLISGNWHVLLVLYVVVAAMVSIVRLLLDQPSALGLVTAPLLVIVGGLGLYGLGLVLLDSHFERNGARKMDESPEPGEELAATVLDSANPDNKPGSSAAFQPFFEYGLALVVTVLCIIIIGDLWGVQETGIGSKAVRFFDIGVVIFIAYLSWKAVKVAIDIKIAEEEPDTPDHESDEIVGTGVSRIATLLPLFRSILFITIFTMAAMIILSDLGVNIGPLIAGAGVIGLAIGFGAQTLVRDILSGAFFLLDDAFRRGEYIDIGSVKGSVEKISIRSMQLRHHKGPLNTVPFGEIQTLTNYSRDWVIMKLPFRVTYDTDVEKVRKLIKKLGQELLQHPDIGSKFLDPLKSQGVYQFEDSAIILRVKFKTKPGDQFEVRKVVYTRLRELFEQEGIHFAHREVTVHVADDDSKPGEKEKQAVAGAVLPLLDDQGGEQQKQPADGM
jgi:small-conductance mechanosensitive channel